jgi:hypothetical protein
MFAWILILGSWVAVLFLILHDATKDDSDGSAITKAAKKAAKNVKAAASLALPKARPRLKTPDPETPQGETPTPVVKQAPLPQPKKHWWRKDIRVAITAPELESAISDAVKKAAPGCEDFVGVIVQHTAPRSHRDPNWDVRGVKFGKADRKAVDEALAAVVERMRHEFLLSDR